MTDDGDDVNGVNPVGVGIVVFAATVEFVDVGVGVGVEAACCIPITFTLENEVKAALFLHSYLAVILFGPGLIVVYFDVISNFHFE
jgi:hypothetical protein